MGFLCSFYTLHIFGTYVSEGKGKHLWLKFTKLFPPVAEQPEMEELIDCLLYTKAATVKPAQILIDMANFLVNL